MWETRWSLDDAGCFVYDRSYVYHVIYRIRRLSETTYISPLFSAFAKLVTPTWDLVFFHFHATFPAYQNVYDPTPASVSVLVTD